MPKFISEKDFEAAKMEYEVSIYSVKRIGLKKRNSEEEIKEIADKIRTQEHIGVENMASNYFVKLVSAGKNSVNGGGENYYDEYEKYVNDAKEDLRQCGIPIEYLDYFCKKVPTEDEIERIFENGLIETKQDLHKKIDLQKNIEEDDDKEQEGYLKEIERLINESEEKAEKSNDSVGENAHSSEGNIEEEEEDFELQRKFTEVEDLFSSSEKENEKADEKEKEAEDNFRDIAEQVADTNLYVLNFEEHPEKKTEYLLSVFDPNNGDKAKDEQDKLKYARLFLSLNTQLKEAEDKLKDMYPAEYSQYIEEKEKLQEIKESREMQLKDLFTVHSGLMQSKGLHYYEKTGNFSEDLITASRWMTPLRKDIIDEAQKAIELINRFKEKTKTIDVDANAPKEINYAYEISPDLKRMKPDTLVTNIRQNLSNSLQRKELDIMEKASALDNYSQIKRIHDQRKKPRWYNFFYRPAYNREKKYIANLEKQLLAKNITAEELCDSVVFNGFTIANGECKGLEVQRDNIELARLTGIKNQVAPVNNLIDEEKPVDKKADLIANKIVTDNVSFQERLKADCPSEGQTYRFDESAEKEKSQQTYSERSI